MNWEKTTVSIIKCDVGSLAGHHVVPKPVMDVGEWHLVEAKEKGYINNFFVFNAGDDLVCAATSTTKLSLIAGKYGKR